MSPPYSSALSANIWALYCNRCGALPRACSAVQCAAPLVAGFLALTTPVIPSPACRQAPGLSVTTTWRFRPDGRAMLDCIGGVAHGQLMIANAAATCFLRRRSRPAVSPECAGVGTGRPPFCCLLFVGCVLFFVRCLLLVVCCLFVVCCLLFVVCCCLLCVEGGGRLFVVVCW